MSEFKVCMTKVLEVKGHENADRLDVVTVYGFQVVARKDSYVVGDICFYIPIDSILPKELEEIIFPADSKIKLKDSRVKQIRIRSFPSQGMLLGINDVGNYLQLTKNKLPKSWDLEVDYSHLLGVTKYEPPVPTFQASNGKTIKMYNNSYFKKYNGIDNIKWNPKAFEGQDVVIQEKLHGSNCRAGLVPTEANTLWKKIKKFFGKLEKYEYVYGSNNVELTNRKSFKGYYGSDIYGAVLNSVKAFENLKENEIIYGELIGEGVQKDYTYGVKGHTFILFDVQIINPEDKTFKWLNPEEVLKYSVERGFNIVPMLYFGPFSKDVIDSFVSGPSVFDPKTKVREGIVVKSRNNYHNPYFSTSKMVLKYINPAYLDKEQSEFH